MFPRTSMSAGTLTCVPGPVRATIRDGRVGREGGSAGVTPEGHGIVLGTREWVEPFYVGDRLMLSDGTEVVAIGVDNHIRSEGPWPWQQTVHVGDVFDTPDDTGS